MDFLLKVQIICWTVSFQFLVAHRRLHFTEQKKLDYILYENYEQEKNKYSISAIHRLIHLNHEVWGVFGAERNKSKMSAEK
jgi:hypothetical protein